MSRLRTVFHVKPGPSLAGSGLLAADRLGLITVVTVVTVIPVAPRQQAMLGEECMAKGRVLKGRLPRLEDLSPEGRGAFAVVESDVARGR